MKRRQAEISQPIVFKRADSKAMSGFDPSTKVCSMNCGAHVDDPRKDIERKFMCDECYTTRKESHE